MSNLKGTRPRTWWVSIVGPIVLLLVCVRLVWDLVDLLLFGLPGGNATLVWVSAIAGVVAAAGWFVTGYVLPKKVR